MKEKGNTKHQSKKEALYELTGKPSLSEALPLAMQHVAAMIVGCVTPAIMIAAAAGLKPEDTRILIQAALILSGIATLIQVFQPFGVTGSGLPVITGVSFAYLPTMLGIVSEYSLAAIFGAQLVAGVAGILFGLAISRLRRFFPPVVTGAVVFTIGLSLFPTAVRYMAGGSGSESFSSPKNWILALVTLALVLFFNNFTTGFTRLSSILLAMIIGYGISIPLGMVDFAPVKEAKWFMLPTIGHFGWEFRPSAIISMSVLVVVASVEMIGQFSALTVGAMDREVNTEEMSKGLTGNGISTIAGALIGGLPTSTFGQNVGIVITNKVISRRVIGFASAILLAAGLLPKLSAVLMSIPQSVIGGATVSVFSTICMTGIKLFSLDGMTPRKQVIVGISVAIGMGISSVDGALALMPAWIDNLFGGSAVVVVTVLAILLNLVLPAENKNMQKKQQ